ncbi:hypothetical protein T484DRAFT_1804020 [Baffinella frigidus]|nr:hypothetical protein T484DRAFT_1804020 [Cryptophyta sp. CCMP2293]
MNALDISDRTIVAGVLTIRSADNKIVGRRLLMHDGDGASVHDIAEGFITDEPGSAARRMLQHPAVSPTAPFHTTIQTGVRGPDGKVYPHVHMQRLQKQLKEQYKNSRKLHPMPGDIGGAVIGSNDTAKGRNRRADTAKTWSLGGKKTKLATLGNKALSRHLLQAGDPTAEAEHLEAIRNNPGAQVFEMSNSFVVPALNIAHMTGHDSSSWQMFVCKVRKEPDISMDLFKRNLNQMLTFAGKHIGPGVRTAKTIGFTRTPADGTVMAAYGSRRLLQLQEADSLSATVDVQGIISMDAGFGALYATMFRCIMANAAASTVNITYAIATETATACNTSAGMAGGIGEVKAVQAALLTSCGTNGALLSEDKCNVFYEALLYTAPTVAFDYYFAQSTTPKLAFTIESPLLITSANEATVVYSVRNNIATAETGSAGY